VTERDTVRRGIECGHGGSIHVFPGGVPVSGVPPLRPDYTHGVKKDKSAHKYINYVLTRTVLGDTF